MNVWINGRSGAAIDCRDRGLQYGDGLFETMRVRRRGVRLLDFHLQRLAAGCARLRIELPEVGRLRREIARAAALRDEGVLKLIVTRGAGARGYRPPARERATRILMLGSLPAHARAAEPSPARVRLCRTRLGANERLAGLKTLNRLESVLARMEWRDQHIFEGLLLDTDGYIVCGTMSNVFLRRGANLTTPPIDRCGVAGVMRRWVLEQARSIGLRASVRRVRVEDLDDAQEMFLSNAIMGPMPVGVIMRGNRRVRPSSRQAALMLRARLQAL